MFPSLLWLDPIDTHPAVEPHVFTDCGLAALLPGAAIDVLAHLCTPAEITMRQSLFSRLRDRGLAPKYAELGQALDSFSAAYHAWSHAVTEAERLFLRVALLHRYAELFPLMRTLAADGLLSPMHAEFWPTQADMHNALTDALADMDAQLNRLATANLTWSLKDGAALTSPSPVNLAIAQRASVCAAALGLELPADKSSPLRMDAGFSDALLTLHREAADALATALAAFDALPCAELLICRDELNFCRNICDLLARATSRGLAVTLPTIADSPRYTAIDLCDLTLLMGDSPIVPNDAGLTPDRRFFFLTGANGGGKTTYLRTLVGNLLLFLGGCPIAAERAEIYPWRAVATHFPADERFSGTGRFVDELNRADALTAHAGQIGGGECFYCFNETFSGTDRQKGLSHTVELAERLAEAGVSGLFVTHFHEVSETGLPMLCTVIDREEENRRTYRIVEQAGIGSSFARDILRKYRLDAASLAARLAQQEAKP